MGILPSGAPSGVVGGACREVPRSEAATPRPHGPARGGGVGGADFPEPPSVREFGSEQRWRREEERATSTVTGQYIHAPTCIYTSHRPVYHLHPRVYSGQNWPTHLPYTHTPWYTSSGGRIDSPSSSTEYTHTLLALSKSQLLARNRRAVREQDVSSSWAGDQRSGFGVCPSLKSAGQEGDLPVPWTPRPGVYM